MEKQFVTQWNGLHVIDKEVNLQPSLTVPDEAMTVAELMRRQAAGLPLGGQRMAMYDDDTDESFIDMESLDLAERQELLQSYNRIIRAQRSAKVQRNSGEKGDMDTEGQPDPNILKKPGVQGQSPAIPSKGSESQKEGEK